MGNYIMLDFPFFSIQERQEENVCVLENAGLERESCICTNRGHSAATWADRTSSRGLCIPFSFLLPQSWSRLNEFHRPDSEFWLFLFFLSTFRTKPFIKATSIVIDWFLWFSICSLLEWMRPELLRTKLLRNKKQRVTAEPSRSSNQDLTMIGIFYFGSSVIFP